ncbi:MAG: hypothetical protein HQK79_20670 [Desulfobacterales bacterium]|nr:hypothetical protein [Desulfobacterales bacterium]
MNKEEKYINLIKNKKRFTTSIERAIEASKQSGDAPIEHISPRVRDVYLKAHPELAKKTKLPV